jgi:predicted membrane protein
MIPYSVLALISVTILAAVHLYTESVQKWVSKWWLLAAGSGCSLAYVFIDLLPKLNQKSLAMQAVFAKSMPYLERHAFFMALMGFLLFYIVDYKSRVKKNEKNSWLPLGSYALLNFLVGYAVVDKANLEVQPLVLFTIAMSFFYFTKDYTLQTPEFHQLGRWILIGALFMGWLIGVFIVLPQAAVALVSAFIGGGVIFNVTRRVLTEKHSLIVFLSSTLIYTFILMAIGS